MHITLDPENVPKEFVLVEIDSSFYMPFNELYVMRDTSGGGDTKNNQSEDEELEVSDEADKRQVKEYIFRINRESLERDFNLTTLSLEKIQVINMKEVVRRNDGNIYDNDMALISEGMHSQY